jgi:DNA-directed RNA polymerase subunit E'/Rpb7
MSSPYTDKDLYRVVSLQPHQMNTNIYLNLKENLQSNILRKCIDGGYICKIYEIIDYKDGEIPVEDFTGNAKYNVHYSARICCPIDGLSLICQINIINKALAEAYNGPIKVIIENLKHNPIKFSTNQNGNLYYKEHKKIVKKDDIIKVKITWKTCDIGSDHILVFATIEDMANKDEINQFNTEMSKEKENKYIKSSMVNLDMEPEDEVI